MGICTILYDLYGLLMILCYLYHVFMIVFDLYIETYMVLYDCYRNLCGVI